jgi:YgiT-type zinc finger domain-containing protein
MRITRCPSCGSKKVKRVRRNLVEEYQGRRYTVPNLEFHECPDCGEKIYDPEAMRRIEAVYPCLQARTVLARR